MKGAAVVCTDWQTDADGWLTVTEALVETLVHGGERLDRPVLT